MALKPPSHSLEMLWMEMANRERRVLLLQELSPRGTLKLSDKPALKDLPQTPCRDKPAATSVPTSPLVAVY